MKLCTDCEHCSIFSGRNITCDLDLTPSLYIKDEESDAVAMIAIRVAHVFPSYIHVEKSGNMSRIWDLRRNGYSPWTLRPFSGTVTRWLTKKS